MGDNTIDLLFEIREALTDYPHKNRLHADLTTRLINHTNAYAERSKRRPNGNASRDRLVAAALNLRSEHQG